MTSGFTDEHVGMDIWYKRQIRNVTAEAQGVVDEQDRRIVALQRRLAATQRQLSTATATVESMRAERGARNQRRALEVLRARHH